MQLVSELSYTDYIKEVGEEKLMVLLLFFFLLSKAVKLLHNAKTRGEKYLHQSSMIKVRGRGQYNHITNVFSLFESVRVDY